jgi:hypothetical protein
MKSNLHILDAVRLPEWRGDRIYMERITVREGRVLILPKALYRWKHALDDLLSPVDGERDAFVMVDQGEVAAGATHRRPGPHIDGNWLADVKAHGGVSPGTHAPFPTLPPSPKPKPVPEWSTGGGGWGSRELTPEAIFLVSDVAACVGYIGEIEGAPGVGGDCSHLDLGGVLRIPLRPNVGYVGNVTFIHESIPVPTACRRTVLRVNVPGWEME